MADSGAPDSQPDPSETARLQAEVADLRGRLDEQERRRSRRTRSFVSWVVALLAILALTMSAIGVWTWRTVTNTDLFVDRVGSIIEEPAVVDAISERVSTAIVDGLDLQERVAEVLPEGSAILAAPISEAARSFLRDATEDLVESEQFRAAWDTTLALSHSSAIAVLEGKEDGALTVTDGAVTVNLVPLINEVLTATEGFLAGLFNREIDLPTVTEEQLDEAIAAIEAQFDVDLPADFGQVTLFASDELGAAQNAYSLAQALVWLLPISALLLAGLAVALALHRGRMALSLVLGVAVALLLVGLALQPVENALVGAVAEQGLAGAVGSAFESVFSSLVDGIVVILILGVAAAVGLLLTGQSRAAQATRAQAAAMPLRAGRYRPIFLVIGVAAALLLLAVIPGRSFGQFFLVLLMLAVYTLAVLLAPRPPDGEGIESGDDEAQPSVSTASTDAP